MSQRDQHPSDNPATTQADAVDMSAEEGKCIFSSCNAKGALPRFKTVAVQKIVDTSKQKRDELYTTLTESDILAHKSCYCSYTSMSRNKEQIKRKDRGAHIGVCKRLLKYECSAFEFKRRCLLCGSECKPKVSKNPRRWVEVRQCLTVHRGSSTITFKQQLENLCEERQDQ